MAGPVNCFIVELVGLEITARMSVRKVPTPELGSCDFWVAVCAERPGSVETGGRCSDVLQVSALLAPMGHKTKAIQS